jgi:hypothetical protein
LSGYGIENNEAASEEDHCRSKAPFLLTLLSARDEGTGDGTGVLAPLFLPAEMKKTHPLVELAPFLRNIAHQHNH